MLQVKNRNSREGLLLSGTVGGAIARVLAGVIKPFLGREIKQGGNKQNREQQNDLFREHGLAWWDTFSKAHPFILRY